MFAEETRGQKGSNYPQWYRRGAAICLNTDGDDWTFNTEDSGDEFNAHGSGVGSDDVDGNDDNGDDDDDDDSDNNNYNNNNTFSHKIIVLKVNRGFSFRFSFSFIN